MKKNHMLPIRFTDKEWSEMNNNSRKLKLSKAEYCRLKIFDPDIIESELWKRKIKKFLLTEL